jgi:enoyl-CoA hydratase
MRVDSSTLCAWLFAFHEEGIMSTVLYEKKNRLVIITINRPEVMNCIDPETDKKLAEAWNQFKDDDGAFVAVITAAGDQAFCSGADLRAWPPFMTKKDAGFHRRRAYDGPEIALAADMRIAAEHAEFGCLERRWNVGLGDGGTQRLWRVVGLGRAMELILTGKRVRTPEALAMGLINEVVPRGKALERCLELGERLCQFPQGAIRTDKEAVLRGIGEPLTEGLRIEAMLFNSLIGTRDFSEGPAAFVEKRKPQWRND